MCGVERRCVYEGNFVQVTTHLCSLQGAAQTEQLLIADAGSSRTQGMNNTGKKMSGQYRLNSSITMITNKHAVQHAAPPKKK